MSLIKLPEIKADLPVGVTFDLAPDALKKWTPEIQASSEPENTISMYEPIGSQWDGTGVTAKRISAALRSIGKNDIVVNINSPGGNFFEGVAIYNMLRSHQYKVTVNVLGLAASAASVIAMSGDEILMGDGAFLMIHNSWGLSIGDRHDMAKAASMLEPFDKEMAELYSARTGIDLVEIESMMDKETWISSKQAIEFGFATGVLAQSAVSANRLVGNKKALALVESAMAKAGYSRSSRRETLQQLFSGKPSAANNDSMPCAGEMKEINSLIQILRG